MKKQIIPMTIVLALSTGFQAQANVDLDDVTMDIATEEVKRGKKINFQLHQTIQSFRLENGDVTQEELAANKADREANREEMKVLKESGDIEGLKAKRAELKAKHEERRAAMKEYIDNNEELKTALQTQKQEIKAQRKERKEEYRDRKEARKETKGDRKDARKAE
jgi:hypothetical protein